MNSDYNLHFLEQKLYRLRSAVMYSFSNNNQTLPNDIVSFVKADVAGNLWLITHKPKWMKEVYDQRFPVKMVFYQKGVEFFVETTGTAILANADELSQYEGEIGEGALLLKMTPSVIEYTDTTIRHPWAGLSKFYQNCTSFLSAMFAMNTSNSRFSPMSKSKGFS